VRAVAAGLIHSLGDGRRAVSMIVGRDTADMDEAAVARAAIESAAENFSDGVIAPIFWFALAGLPGLLMYKIVNTADSMIGYKTERYAEFGWAAARLDDVLNWIPARLTALLICLRFGLWRHWPQIVADAWRHRSPNAGWPEATMARALNVALAGPRSYDGELRDFPFVNPDGDECPGASEVTQSTSVLWQCWWLVLIFAGTVTLWRHAFVPATL
jgi:adenosylcobinamide-phosphate synthase